MRPAASTLLPLALASAPAFGRVTRVEIVTRASVAGGKPFGGVGSHEKVIGRVHFAVGPGGEAEPARRGPRQGAAEDADFGDGFLLRRGYDGLRRGG